MDYFTTVTFDSGSKHANNAPSPLVTTDHGDGSGNTYCVMSQKPEFIEDSPSDPTDTEQGGNGSSQTYCIIA